MNRRVRVNAYTPIYQVLREAGVPLSPENGQQEGTAHTYVASFYEKSPNGAVTIDTLSALDQLEHWKLVKLNWCEHNPSTTIECKEDDKEIIAKWLYQNQDIINGIAFLTDDHIYEQPPYEALNEEEFSAAYDLFPEVDFSKLLDYESTDMTQRGLECVAGVCDLF